MTKYIGFTAFGNKLGTSHLAFNTILKLLLNRQTVLYLTLDSDLNTYLYDFDSGNFRVMYNQKTELSQKITKRLVWQTFNSRNSMLKAITIWKQKGMVDAYDYVIINDSFVQQSLPKIRFYFDWLKALTDEQIVLISQEARVIENMAITISNYQSDDVLAMQLVLSCYDDEALLDLKNIYVWLKQLAVRYNNSFLTSLKIISAVENNYRLFIDSEQSQIPLIFVKNKNRNIKHFVKKYIQLIDYIIQI